MADSSDHVRVTLEGLSELYGENLRRHGLSSKSVGWKDAASQQLRFEKLAQVIRPGGAAITVNDWGCGYGAMLPFLDAIPGVQLAAYRGYDISPEMLAAARNLYGSDPRVALVQSAEIDSSCDYAFVSGTFNVRFAATDDEWRAYIEQTILRLGETSRKGFAFNLLSSYVDWRDPQLFYGDPSYFLDFCKRRISRSVALLHDYPLYEWTMHVVMEP